MKKALIVAASYFKEDNVIFNDDYYKVAVDNGYMHFYDNKIICDLLVGDFDTLKISDFSYAKKVIKLKPQKDDTDTFYTVKYLLTEGYDDFTFYGCLGNRNDMTFSSYSILYYLLKKRKKAILISDDEEVVLLSKEYNSSYVFSTVGIKFSLLSLSYESDVRLVGYQYDYEGKMSLDTPLGISNAVKNSDNIISVKEGILLLFIHKK